MWIKSEVQGEPGAPWSPRRPLLQHLLELEGPRILGGGEGAAMWTAEEHGQRKACPELGCCGKRRLSWASVV